MRTNLSRLESLLTRTPAWLSRHLGTTLATTLIFVSATSAFSLLDAFH